VCGLIGTSGYFLHYGISQDTATSLPLQTMNCHNEEWTRSDMIINTKKCWHVEGREIFTDIMRAQLRKRSGNWPPKMVSCSQQSLPYWLYCYNKPALDLSIHPLIILKTKDHASVSTCLLIPTNTAFVQSFITTVVFCRTPDQSPCHSSLPASIDLSHSCQLSLHFLAQGNDKE
jgi:hypothetical protein